MQFRPSIPPGGIFPQPYEYPPVDISLLTHSVGESRILLQQADKLIEKLNDNEFATKIMELAQEGKQESVDQMVHSIIGANASVKTEYTPTGVNFHLASPTADNQHVNCCHIDIALKWGK